MPLNPVIANGGWQLVMSLTMVLLIALSSQMFPYFTNLISNTSPTISQTAYAEPLPDFNIASVGDWGCHSDITKKTVDNIVSKSPELVLSLGDNSYDPKDDCWFKTIAPIDNLTKLVIGNHDYDYPGKLSQYMSHFKLEKQFYSFNYQYVHFTVMSTEIDYDETSEQYEFVKNDLAAAASNPDIRWIVVAFHAPMYLSHQADEEHVSLSDLRDAYHPLFDRYNVDLVLQAHQHAYERTFPIKYNSTQSSAPIITDNTSASSYVDPQGEIFATVGTGGQSLDLFLGKSSFSAIQFYTYGFLNIDMINGGSTLRATFYGNDNTVRDQFTIVKSPPTNNRPPIAQLTADQTIVDEFQISNIDAGASFDPDSDSITYVFRQIAGTPGTIITEAQNPSKAVFEAPSVSVDETDTIELTVDDGNGGIKTATMDILVKNQINNTVPCNCVIFRIDDITDYSYSDIKRTVMDQFITKHQNFVLAIVLNHFGKDQNVVDKVGEGFSKGLFELAIHAWDHVKFPSYSLEQQKAWLESSNSKLKDMFGTTSQVFLPPYGVANTDTLIAMSKLNYKILSVQNKTEFFPPFVSDGSNQHDGYGIYHLPYSAHFVDYGSEEVSMGIKIPVETVVNDIDWAISKYGYAVVVMHPPDFAIKVDGKPTREVDQSQIDDLNFIIDTELAKGRFTTTYSKLLGLVTPPYVDRVAPSIIAPEDIGALQTGNLTKVSLGLPLVRDNADPSPAVTNDAPMDGFPLGTTLVTWTATDASGNTAMTHQYVTIGLSLDTTSPQVSVTLPRTGTMLEGPPTGIPLIVTGTASDTGSGIKLIELKTGSQPFQKVTPKAINDWSIWQKTVTIQDQGTVYLQAKAIDYFGNVRWSNKIPITITFENNSKASSADTNILSLPSNITGGILSDLAGFEPTIMIIPVVAIPSIIIYLAWRQRAQKGRK